MAGKTNKSEKGAVLIIVLFIIAGLAVVAIDLNRNVLLDHAFSLAMESGAASKPLLRNGENLAARFLVRDLQKEKKQPGNESFASLCSRLAEFVKIYSAKLQKWDLEIELEDENSRFPLKALFPEYSSEEQRAEFYASFLQRMLTSLLLVNGYEGGEDAARMRARRFVEELQAWGGQRTLSDEAARWYLTRKPAYYPPFRAPACLSELLLVYWPDVEEEVARNTLLGTETTPGLLDSCSLWAIGPINMNTMKTAVGWGFCGFHQEAVEFMKNLERTRAAQGEWLKSGWYMDVFAAHNVVSPPVNVIAEQSRWFRTRVTARRGLSQNSSEAVGWINKSQITWVSRAVL